MPCPDSPSTPSGRAQRPWLLIGMLLLAGCGDDPVSPDYDPGALSGIWLGALVTSGSGSAVLDLHPAAGSGVTGRMVMRWPPGTADARFVDLAGTATGSELELTSIAGAETLTVLLTRTGSELQGSISSSAGPAGTLDLDRVPQAGLHSQPFLTLPGVGVKAMAFAGDTLWIATTGHDHLLVTRDGVVADTVAVIYGPGTHWTSDVLTHGGGMSWGHLNQTQDGQTVSHVLPFTREGIQPGDFLLTHFSSGLAHDGSHLWSLSRDEEKLYRVTESGSVADSLRVRNPDLISLVREGSSFWAAGWYIPALWKLDAAGNAVAVQPLHAGQPAFPAGLAFDGEYLYYARADLSGTSIYRFVPGAATP